MRDVFFVSDDVFHVSGGVRNVGGGAFDVGGDVLDVGDDAFFVGGDVEHVAGVTFPGDGQKQNRPGAAFRVSRGVWAAGQLRRVGLGPPL